MGGFVHDATVLLTGAVSPTALTVARRLGNEGASLAYVGADANSSEGIRDLLCQFRRRAFALSADTTDRAAVESAVVQVEGRFGPVDYLVHTLGSAGTVTVSTDRGVVVRSTTAPLAAALTCTSTVLDRMRRRRCGHIIHLVSGSQIGALEIERTALSRLGGAAGGVCGSTGIALSALFFDDVAARPGTPALAGSTVGRLLETCTGRLVEEDDWAERVLLECGIGDAILHLLAHPHVGAPDRVRAFGLRPGGEIAPEAIGSLGLPA